MAISDQNCLDSWNSYVGIIRGQGADRVGRRVAEALAILRLCQKSCKSLAIVRNLHLMVSVADEEYIAGQVLVLARTVRLAQLDLSQRRGHDSGGMQQKCHTHCF